jgi:hypothetical protein
VIGLFIWPRLWSDRSPIQYAMDLPGMQHAARFSARMPAAIVALGR